MKNTAKKIVRGAIIAAVYATLTVVTQPISYGAVQFRVSEALTLLPFLFPEAVWGLTLGCLISNIFGGQVIDIIFGTLATFLGAFFTRKIKKMWLAPLPTVLFNGIIVGAVVTLASVEFTWTSYLLFAMSITVSESIICYCGGIPLLIFTEKLSKSGLL